ncbi:hypothetical protein PM082_010217 [Marasmius tenuissimus]|nr:hypothetical protein PM082_010217 [Marasmius tenuissimus]
MVLSLLQSWFASSPLPETSGSPSSPEHSEPRHEPPDNRPLLPDVASQPSKELPPLSSSSPLSPQPSLSSFHDSSVSTVMLPSSSPEKAVRSPKPPPTRPSLIQQTKSSTIIPKNTPICSAREHNHDCGGDRSRNLVICIDGTSNKFSSRNTNVVELYSRLQKDKDQLTYYDSGIGTYPVPNHKNMKYYVGVIQHKLDLMFAFRFQQTILKAYAWLSEYYRPNDRIYLIGFSRGAYQARALSAMIEKVGLIHKGNEGQIPFAYELYYRSQQKHGEPPSQLTNGRLRPETSVKLPHLDSPKRLGVERGAEEPALRFKRTFCRNVKVHFVGAWDTVSSVGVVRNESLPMTMEGMQHVCYFRHALALDERRIKFLPDYACGGGSPISDSGKNSSMPHTKEVWFVGTHSDIGGGNADNTALNNNRPALRWMSQEAARAGLRIEDLFVGSSTNDPTMKDGAEIQESLKGLWRALEYFPLKHLAYDSKSAQTTNTERSYVDDNKTTRRPHLGKRRPILPGQFIHQSVYSAKKGQYASKNLPHQYRDSSIYEYIEPDSTPNTAYEFLTYFQTLTLLHHKRVYKSIQVHPPSPDPASEYELVAVMEKFKRMATEREGQLQFQDLIHKLYEDFQKVDSPKQQCDATGAMDALIQEGALLFQKNAPRRLPPVLGDMMRLPRKNDDLKEFARKFLSTFGTGEIFTLPQTGPVWVSISADGNRLVYLARDSGRVTVVDTTSNSFDKVDSSLQPDLSLLPSEVRGARCIAISPNGGLVAVGFNEPREAKRVVVWNLEKRGAIQKNHEKDSILDVRFSSDNGRIYYSTSGPSGHVIWSWCVPMKESDPPLRDMVGTLDGMKAFYGPDGVITGLSISQDSKKLVAISEDKMVRMWDVESTSDAISADSYGARAVTFPTSRYFYTGGDDGAIRRWTRLGQTFSTEELTAGSSSAINALAGADNRLACGLDDALGTVEIFDVSAKPIQPVGETMYHHSAIYSLSYAGGVQGVQRERRCIAAGTRYRGGVTLWDEEGPSGKRLLDHVTNEGFFFK